MVLSRYLNILREQPRPGRFLVSRLLMRSGLSRRMTFARNGYRLRFNPTALAASLWLNPSERIREEHFLQACLDPGDTVIDIGANIGNVCLACARAVGETGRVLAVEPHPRIYRSLVENVALNGIGRTVETVNVALGDGEGAVRFTDASDDTQNTIARDGGAGTIEVAMRPLDTIAPEGEIALMKIDAEGYEPWIIAGASSACSRTRMLYAEFNPALIRGHGGDPVEFLDGLRRHGFRLSVLGDEGLTEMTDMPEGKCMLVGLRRSYDAWADRIGAAARGTGGAHG